MNTIILRKEAKISKLRHYFTGKQCKYGHINERLTSTGQCCECVRLNHYKDYAKNKDKRLAEIKKWSQANPTAVNEHTAKWRKNNPTQSAESSRLYYEKNSVDKLQYNKMWRSINKDKLNQYNADRRARILNATVSWSDADKMCLVYKEANDLTENTNTDYHVDHVIPLVHNLVCGLHCEANLQVIPANENLKKGNTFIIS